MAKAVFVAEHSMFPPLSLESTLSNCFRIFSQLNVVTAADQDRFDPMLEEMRSYGKVAVRAHVGPFLGFAGHLY